MIPNDPVISPDRPIAGLGITRDPANLGTRVIAMARTAAALHMAKLATSPTNTRNQDRPAQTRQQTAGGTR